MTAGWRVLFKDFEEKWLTEFWRDYELLHRWSVWVLIFNGIYARARFYGCLFVELICKDYEQAMKLFDKYLVNIVVCPICQIEEYMLNNYNCLLFY